MRAEIISIVSAAALIVDEEKHSRLKSASDMDTNEYKEIRKILNRFQNLFPRIHYIHTVIKTTEPGVWMYVVDGTDPRDENGDGIISPLEDVTPLGETFDVGEYHEFHNAFETPIAGKEILKDKWGWFLSASAPIKNDDGKASAIVGVDVSAKKIKEEYDRLKNRILILFLLSLAFSAFLSSILSKSLTSPILRIITTTERITDGEYGTILEMERNDELGNLVYSINSMSKGIKKSFENLNILYDSSVRLSKSLDLRQALHDSLMLLDEVFHCSKTLILLFDEQNDYFRLGAHSGFENLREYKRNIWLDGEIFDTAADPQFMEYFNAHPKLYTLGVVRAQPELVQALGWLERTTTTAIAPLMGKDGIKGIVLMMAHFEEPDFVYTFLNQMSLSLENAKLFYDATRDGLTKLYLRRIFDLTIVLEMKRAIRHKRNFVLLMIDIDHFKKVNDKYTHQGGDEVLREAANLIREQIRASDIATRYGGEEFAIILPECSLEDGKTIAEKIRSTMEEKEIIYEEQKIVVRFSIGVAQFLWKLPVTAEQLITAADTALYRAKNEGRNRICIAENRS